jgi:purine nucleosidase
MPRKIIIDTDPGQDDAVAILLALASPEDFDVIGVVAVAGNVGLHHNATNARKIVELAGRPDVPVYAGCARPMRRTLVTAEHVHGDTGLNGPDLPAPKTELQPQHGVDYIIETLMNAEPKTITLCTLGPLTNIGMALVKEPKIAERVAEIVMMGGADIVFRSGIKITVLPLDVTHQIQSTPPRLAAIKALGNRSGEAVHAMLSFSETFDLKKYGWEGAPLHDPTVIAYLIDPTLFEGRECNVTIETASELTVGMTVTDYWHVTDKPRNATYLRNGNAEGFFKLLTERLARLP